MKGLKNHVRELEIEKKTYERPQKSCMRAEKTYEKQK